MVTVVSGMWTRGGRSGVNTSLVLWWDGPCSRPLNEDMFQPEVLITEYLQLLLGILLSQW